MSDKNQTRKVQAAGHFPALLTWTGWIVFAAAICLVSQHQGFKRTVVPAYRAASLAWTEGKPIYELQSIHGFLYLPSAAALTVPFLALPAPAHELIFRAASIALLAWSTWRLACCLKNALGNYAFPAITLLVVPNAIGSAVAGQMNILLAATMAAAAADMVERRWNRAAAWMAFGFALKPQMAVFILLASVVFPSMRLPGAIGGAAALLVPFASQWPLYVFAQYRLCWDKLLLSGNPTSANAHFNDVFGLLSSIAVDLPDSTQWIIRLVALPLTVMCARRAAAGCDPARGVFTTLAWAAAYMMLFNPRTEGGSYIIAAMPLAVLAAYAVVPRIKITELSLLVLIAAGWAASFPISQALHELATTISGGGSGGGFHYWLSPLLAIVFVAYLAYLLRKPQRFESARASTPAL